MLRWMVLMGWDGHVTYVTELTLMSEHLMMYLLYNMLVYSKYVNPLYIFGKKSASCQLIF